MYKTTGSVQVQMQNADLETIIYALFMMHFVYVGKRLFVMDASLSNEIFMREVFFSYNVWQLLLILILIPILILILTYVCNACIGWT